ncbi:hypothetical protein [Allosphingosinicella deserti]|uniref:hypothetical protein n=1 Tax=Allosphingosinicella deserti TaxID=2116704 RepID=UPI0011B24C4E|nr:hypothetical protein [Sphingomonas deserti]
MNWLLTRLLRVSIVLLVSAAGASAAAQTNVAAVPQTSSSHPIKPNAGQDAFVSELSRIEREIFRVNNELRSLNDLAGAVDLRTARTTLQSIRGAVNKTSLCRGNRSGATTLPPELNALLSGLATYSRKSESSYVWEEGPPDLDEICSIGIDNYLDRIGRGIDQLSHEFGNLAGRKTGLERELKDLQERRQNVLAEMSEGTAAARVAKNIPVLMLIIFGVGAIVLGGLKMFSDEIQLELVSSGQIVQFVTILILLGIILALGLADRLNEEALGTLLGGLAGYVLSQGVGRQVQSGVIAAVKSAAPPS